MDASITRIGGHFFPGADRQAGLGYRRSKRTAGGNRMAERLSLAAADRQRVLDWIAQRGMGRIEPTGRVFETMSTTSLPLGGERGDLLFKLYQHPGRYRREVNALGKLTGSGYGPDLIRHGPLQPALLLGHQRSRRELNWTFFVLRTWLPGAPGVAAGADRDRLAKAMYAFADFCALHQLRIGEMKPDSFIYRADRLTWIDFDGFRNDDGHQEPLRKHNRRYLRQRFERLA